MHFGNHISLILITDQFTNLTRASHASIAFWPACRLNGARCRAFLMLNYIVEPNIILLAEHDLPVQMAQETALLLVNIVA